MKTPHPAGSGDYQDPYQNRELPEEEERLVTMGYTFLGWNISHHSLPEYQHCMDEGHNYYSMFPNVWRSVQHTPSGSDVTQWCTKCKIYWKVDMSD